MLDYSTVPAGSVKLYNSPFLRDFWHLNVAMMQSNNALIPDEDKDDIIASKPLDWPLQHVGMRMNGWGDRNPKYALFARLLLERATSDVQVQILSFGPSHRLAMVDLELAHLCPSHNLVSLPLPKKAQ